MSTNFADRDGLIWFDGELVPWRDAKVHVLTHTLHYGLGVFEGVRAYATDQGPAIFRMQDHTDRLFRSAHILSMKLPFTKEQINAAQIDVVKQNKLKEA
ncbi:MAG: branched-chain amino acid aminotransferase, partial [Candidatus Azotimanducaceae bacterium]